MSVNANAHEAALLLIRQYGEDASAIAVLRAAELAASGDVDGLSHWDDIIREIEGLTRPNPNPRGLN
jgi:hypothetical protein